MRRVLASVVTGLGAAAVLGGCAGSTATPISLEEGDKGHLIDCGGFSNSMSDCVAQANALCEGDYAVVATTGQLTGGSGIRGVLADMDRGMVVRCRADAG